MDGQGGGTGEEGKDLESCSVRVGDERGGNREPWTVGVGDGLANLTMAALLFTQEKEELNRKVEEELKKQESLISHADIQSGLVPRTKRRCVIVREQMSKKKEWWEEEGLVSDDEDDEDIGM